MPLWLRLVTHGMPNSELRPERREMELVPSAVFTQYVPNPEYHARTTPSSFFPNGGLLGLISGAHQPLFFLKADGSRVPAV